MEKEQIETEEEVDEKKEEKEEGHRIKWTSKWTLKKINLRRKLIRKSTVQQQTAVVLNSGKQQKEGSLKRHLKMHYKINFNRLIKEKFF